MAGNGNGPLFRPRSAKVANNPVIPEIEVYLHLLILIYLLDIKRYEKVSQSTRLAKFINIYSYKEDITRVVISHKIYQTSLW